VQDTDLGQRGHAAQPAGGQGLLAAVMSLDPVTGLDPEGIRLRAHEGLDGVDFFVPVRASRCPMCHVSAEPVGFLISVDVHAIWRRLYMSSA